MLPIPIWLKFAISITYDVVDIFSVPVLGSLYDIIGVPLGVALWGPWGFAQIWEVLDPTDVVDRFVPTMTIAGLIVYYGGR